MYGCVCVCCLVVFLFLGIVYIYLTIRGLRIEAAAGILLVAASSPGRRHTGDLGGRCRHTFAAHHRPAGPARDTRVAPVRGTRAGRALGNLAGRALGNLAAPGLGNLVGREQAILDLPAQFRTAAAAAGAHLGGDDGVAAARTRGAGTPGPVHRSRAVRILADRTY